MIFTTANKLATSLHVAIRGADPEICAVKDGAARDQLENRDQLRLSALVSGKMAKEEDSERLRARAPELEVQRDMCIDDALEEVWGAVETRQGSNRSRVSIMMIVHHNDFDNLNGKSNECQYDSEWMYLRDHQAPSAERNRELI